MASQCAACSHPERKDLELMLTTGTESLTSLAGIFEVDVQCLRRHKESHFKPLLPVVLSGKTDPVTLLGELDVVKQTAQRFVQHAEDNGKLYEWECPKCGTTEKRMEGADLALGVSALREWRHTLEATIKIAGSLGVLAPNSNQVNKAVNLILKALEPYPDAKDAVLEALREIQ